MKKLAETLSIAASKVDSQKVRLVITVATLVLFVLAAGAPGATGDIGH